jgi:hypothetical protein
MLHLTKLIVLLSLIVLSLPVTANSNSDSIQILKEFTEEKPKSEIVQIDKQTKHKIMFYMAVPLLLLLIITVILGIAMAIYGKQVFVAHMISAGLSLTLAIAHAVVGIVWFFPW